MRPLFPTLLLLALAVIRVDGAEHPRPLALGSPLPDFSLPGVDGRTYTPADFSQAGVFVLVFTSNHCPTAQAYEGRLKQLVADYTPRGVAFLAVIPTTPPPSGSTRWATPISATPSTR